MIKANNQNSVKTRQKFDQTFKREAVNHWLPSGKSASMVALDLGILPNRLYAWRLRFALAAAFPQAQRRMGDEQNPQSPRGGEKGETPQAVSHPADGF